MMKIDVVKAVKILGVVLTVGGAVANGWATDKTNAKTLEMLVNKKFEK